MNKQIDEMAKVIARRRKNFRNPNVAFMTTARNTAESLYNAGYSRREDVARDIFEELSATIMPLVESHNRIAEKTGDREWGYRADGLETVLIALKVILKKYGVTEDEY